MKVKFHFEQPVSLNNRKHLKVFIESMFRTEKQPAKEIAFIFCCDNRLLNINREFLKHDYFTDIITFDLTNEKTDPKVGEIYISIDRVKDNAKTHKVFIVHELHRVVFHGILHLCGYRDKTKTEQKSMRSKEEFYLNKYGIFDK